VTSEVPDYKKLSRTEMVRVLEEFRSERDAAKRDVLRAVEERNALIAELQAITARLQAQNPQSQRYGCHVYACHVDLDVGEQPDECVLDKGLPEHCLYARKLTAEGKDKTACGYWRPIVPVVKDDCKCTGPSHKRGCREWVLPL
jgi:hypothetical protein